MRGCARARARSVGGGAGAGAGEGIKPGKVTAEGLEMIFPISTGIRGDDGYPVRYRHIMGEDIDDFIERMCQFLQEKVDDEENDRGNGAARHQAEDCSGS